MWDIIAGIIKYMWKEKPLRVYLINLIVTSIAVYGLISYVNRKHTEALASINSVKTSQEDQNKALNDNVLYIRGRVDELYNTFIH